MPRDHKNPEGGLPFLLNLVSSLINEPALKSVVGNDSDELGALNPFQYSDVTHAALKMDRERGLFKNEEQFVSGFEYCRSRAEPCT